MSVTYSTYEVFIDVRHHPKHLDGTEFEKRDFGADKLVDTGNVGEMVANSLRALADRLEEKYKGVESYR